MTKIISGIGALKNLPTVIQCFGGKKIFIVSGEYSFNASGARNFVEKEFANFDIRFFNNFSSNPKFDDALKGVAEVRNFEPDVILAVGGGSAIDMAKIIKAFVSSANNEAALVTGSQSVVDPKIPLVFIPTTAGPGSEATHFGVIYMDGAKYSLASECLRADVTILDGTLLLSNNRKQLLFSALDGLAQCIESAWAVSSTEYSQLLALRALDSMWPAMTHLKAKKYDASTLHALLLSANLCGQAIDISKTTAPHAWSYAFTTAFGLPHGHAVWLTLPAVFEIHFRRAADCGGRLLRDMEALVKLLGLSKNDRLECQLKNFLNEINVDHDFDSLGITAMSRRTILDEANAERMQNNPIKFTDCENEFIFKLEKK